MKLIAFWKEALGTCPRASFAPCIKQGLGLRAPIALVEHGFSTTKVLDSASSTKIIDML